MPIFETAHAVRGEGRALSMPPGVHHGAGVMEPRCHFWPVFGELLEYLLT